MRCHQLLVMSCCLLSYLPIVDNCCFHGSLQHWHSIGFCLLSLLSYCKSWLGLMLVSSSACLLLAVFSQAKCNRCWENFSSAHFRSDICADPRYTQMPKTSAWISAKWALQFHTSLLWESTVSYEIAARCLHILQAIQQTWENYSINLCVKGGKKIFK